MDMELSPLGFISHSDYRKSSFFFWILATVAQNISSAQAVLSTYVGRSKRQSKKFQSCSEKISLHDVVYASPC
jgi:hypothetical protein